MLRCLLIVSLGLGLAGCGGGGFPGLRPDPASPASMDNPPRRSGDGVARKLANGVTKAEADVAMGYDSGYERNPKDFDESCASYNYGTAASPKYVHAVFRADRMVSASDGHLVLCTYEEPAAPAVDGAAL